MRALLRAFVIGLVPALCAAQTAVPDSAATQMVRAAGMPLNDGALAPGMLTVRVVEGAFTRDIANQLVEVEVAGGKIETARTGPDERAQFAHLPVGRRVRPTVGRHSFVLWNSSRRLGDSSKALTARRMRSQLWLTAPTKSQ